MKSLRFLNTFILLSSCFFVKTARVYCLSKTGFAKSSFYFYWGYNRDYFSQSDIHFKGDNYNFTLKHVKANDRQTKLSPKQYLNISQLTIPQYNYRLGYCINARYNISLGFDHMKYVMNQNQTVEVNGYINASGTEYDGEYSNKLMEMKSNFLEFEHTDGLNYLNAEVSRFDKIFNYKDKININLLSGSAIGFMYPRSRVILLGKNVNDQWHISGYGISGHTGLNLLFKKHIFLQSIIKAGYINMSNITTTGQKNDRAMQHFSFIQTNIVLGYRFYFGKRALD